MFEQFIAISALLLINYNVAGLSTTNILRLTAGNSLRVNSSKCVCETCGAPIKPLLQLPIISFIVCRGKCKSCGAKIPIFPLLLEMTVFSGMTVLIILFNYSLIGVVIIFIFYEAVRIVTIILKGKRTVNFFQQYFISVLSMVPFWLVSLFASLLYNTI